ncbi:MAG: SGNH/GDSL hydrolase family protein [Sedimentisphaerales bacterium]
MLRNVVVFATMCCGVASVLSANDANRPEDFGRQWVRSHPFQIMSLVTIDDTFDANVYADAGMNTVLVWKGREGILNKTAAKGLPWHFKPLAKYNDANHPETKNPLTQERMDWSLQFYKKYPSCEGFLVMDEPRHVHFPGLAKAMDWYRTNFPQSLIYGNIYMAGKDPGAYYQSPKDASGQYIEPPVKYEYEDYIREYLEMCRPDILMTDVYPFADYQDLDDRDYTNAKYFSTLEAIRKFALKKNIPYWTFVQSFAHKGNWYYPSESNVRMQVYSSLAYGFTGIAYFLYNSSTDESLIDNDGQPRPLLSDIAVLNKEINILGKSLKFLNSEAVFYISGTQYDAGRGCNNGNPSPKGTTRFDSNKVKPWGIADIKVIGISENKNGLIGFFKDDNGGLYFMLVNLRNARGVPAAQMPGKFVIKFEKSVKELYRVSRQSGMVEKVSFDPNGCEIELPGGTGELFKVNDNVFPGIGFTARSGAKERLLLIGDSIRQSYQPYVTAAMKDGIEVVGVDINTNCRDTNTTLAIFDEAIASTKPTIIHWNNGLHDVKHLNPNADCQVSIDNYTKNLETIISRFKMLGNPKIIWATTTPVIEELHNKVGLRRLNKEIKQYNDAAKAIMKKHGIAIDGLGSIIAENPVRYICEDGVHPTEEGKQVLSSNVVRSVYSAIEKGD